MTGFLRVAVTLVFTILFSINSLSQHLPHTREEFGFSESSSEPPSDAVLNSTPELPMTDRQARLQGLQAKVLQDYAVDHGRGIKFESPNLGRVNTSIDPTDAVAVEGEVRRHLLGFKDLVGDTEKLVLGEFSIVALDGKQQDSQNFLVGFKQLIHGAPVGRGTLGVMSDKLTLVDTHFVDPSQANAQKEFWAPEKQISEAAVEALRIELEHKELDQSLITGPRLTFQIVDENDTIEPWYMYLYPGYVAHVNALTLESVVGSTITHAIPTDDQGGQGVLAP